MLPLKEDCDASSRLDTNVLARSLAFSISLISMTLDKFPVATVTITSLNQLMKKYYLPHSYRERQKFRKCKQYLYP